MKDTHPYNCRYCRKHRSLTEREDIAHELTCPDNPKNIPVGLQNLPSSSWPSDDFDCLGNHIREMGDGDRN